MSKGAQSAYICLSFVFVRNSFTPPTEATHAAAFYAKARLRPRLYHCFCIKLEHHSCILLVPSPTKTCSAAQSVPGSSVWQIGVRALVISKIHHLFGPVPERSYCRLVAGSGNRLVPTLFSLPRPNSIRRLAGYAGSWC